jgi:hypothetical protein
MSDVGTNGDSLHCHVGPELFRFESFQQWVNKASSWFASCGYPSRHAICVDAKGRICQYGKHFMTARDEGTFPVRVCMAREDDKPKRKHERCAVAHTLHRANLEKVTR